MNFLLLIFHIFYPLEISEDTLTFTNARRRDRRTCFVAGCECIRMRRRVLLSFFRFRAGQKRGGHFRFRGETGLSDGIENRVDHREHGGAFRWRQRRRRRRRWCGRKGGGTWLHLQRQRNMDITDQREHE